MRATTTAQILLVMLLWAACFPLITIGIAYAPHLTFAVFRAVLAGGSLIAIAAVIGRPLPRGGRTWASIVGIGLGATGLGFLGMFHAAEFISPGIATVIANTQPLLAAGLAVPILGERLTAQGAVGLVVGFLGIVVITAPHLVSAGADGYLFGVAYVMLAALGVTLGNVLIKRIANDVDAVMAMGLQLLIGSIPLALIAFTLENPGATEWSVEFVVILLLLALPGTSFVFWLWCSVLERVQLNQANAFSFLIPVFGLTIGALFYGETLDWLHLVGIGLTILGVVVVSRSRPQPRQVPESGNTRRHLSSRPDPWRHRNR